MKYRSSPVVQSLSDKDDPCRLVVLISGNGTNLQAIIDRCEDGEIPARVVGVISNEPCAGGLERSAKAGIQNVVIDHRDYSTRSEFDQALGRHIDSHRPDLLILAGFMRILGKELVQRYQGRILNIHPSLLPNYPGLNTHQRALTDGISEHGATVHFVVPQLDAGPIVVQGRIRVYPDDTPDTLAQRVHELEYRIYPQAIRWFAEGRLTLRGNSACLDGLPVRL